MPSSRSKLTIAEARLGLLVCDLTPLGLPPHLPLLDSASPAHLTCRALPHIGADRVDSNLPVRLDVAFKGPMFMERDVAIFGADGAEAPGDAFELYSAGNERPSVVGRWKNVEPSETLVHSQSKL